MTAKIERYDVVYSPHMGGGIGLKYNGLYCKYADYEKVKEQRDKLLEKLKNAEVRLRIHNKPHEALFLRGVNQLIAECEKE